MKGVKNMKIDYHLAGSKRKALVTSISLELSQTPKYLGAPSFAYEIGVYRVDKDGVLSGPDNPGLVADLCGIHDFEAVAISYDDPAITAEPKSEDISIPFAAELGGGVSPYRDYEEPPAYLTPTRLTIEIPSEGFTDESFYNLKRLVSSKEQLIKKALGADTLPIEQKESILSFPWFTLESGNEAVSTKAYSHFIFGLCKLAKTQKWVNASEKTVENEKYAFRCFLLRIGFIGDEFKAERKLLLSRLSGNSAFKNKFQEVEEDE